MRYLLIILSLVSFSFSDTYSWEDGGTILGSYGNFSNPSETISVLIENQLGDVNSDGILNILDIITVANIVIEVLPYDESADLTGDGQVNILDIIFLVNLILNQ